MKALSRYSQQTRRSVYIGRAYAIIGFLGAWSFFLTYRYAFGNFHTGLWIELIIGIQLALSFGLSYVRRIPIDTRLAFLQANYYTYVASTLLMADQNGWTLYFVLSTLVTVMLTFLAIRKNRGIVLMGFLVTVGSALCLFTGPEPEAISATVLFMLIFVVNVGTSTISWQRLGDENKRFKGETALKSSQQILTGVMESTNDLIWSFDRDYILLAANPSFLRFLAAVGESPVRIGDPLPRGFRGNEEYLTYIEKVFGGSVETFHLSIPLNGSTIFLEIRLHPIIEQGKIIAVSGFGRDITAQRTLLHEHEQAKERFENALMATQDGIWEWDLSQQTFFISERFIELLGYKPGEVSRKPEFFGQLIHPEDVQRVLDTFRKHIKTGENQLFGEFRMLHRSGDWMWLEGRGRAVRDEKNWVIRISGAVTDISDRKKTELELTKLSLVASHTSNAVVITDAQGKAEWTNDGFTRLTGYRKEELIGKRPGTLLQGPDTDPKTKAYIASRLSAGESVSTEILNYHKDGHAYWLNMEINPIRDEEGKIINFIAVESDITAQKLHQQQLEEARLSAEQAARAKSEFLATMSHEIRTPMNAVIGMTGLLLDSELNEEQREFVETIRVSGDNLLTIINDILDFSKIDAGKMELEQQAFSLPETVEDVLDLLSGKAQGQGLELTYEADPQAPSVIISDPTRLNQVLVNLVGNAIKFTHEGEVALTIRESHRFRNVSQLQFSIRDTGIGIPQEKVDALFKPFSQVDSSTTRQFGGTGLGLAISSRLVQLMGGKIWVESVPGEGSTFHFTIRAKVEGEQTFGSYVTPAHQHLLSGKRALVVDDNQTNLRILQKQLNGWGMECQTVNNPLLVAEILREQTFDLLILDMNMPEMAGDVLAARLQDTFRDLPPMIMLTSMGQSRKASTKDLFAAYLHKPVRREQFYKHIHRVLIPQQESPESEEKGRVMEHTAVQLPALKILIAEDNLVNQKVARRMLEKLGYQPEVVANGEEAVDMLRKQHFDLIFMDMRMPVMDGLEATEKIRELHLRRQPLICAMTANAMKGDREACLAAGMNDYITKPVKLQAIQEAIIRNFLTASSQHSRSA